ncbi:MAG TPA: outer membrane protein transport protein [Candidatus Eisenbacteria bacterium]|nr:outer membrane protein transport protein [Candidatus Eisenbacteria bacterium]
MRQPTASSIRRSKGGTSRAACALVAIAVAFPNEAHSAGFAVYEQGVAATAQGGAFAARAPDASAVYFNPAALATHEGKEVMVGTTGILLHGGHFTSGTTGDRFDQVDNTTFPSYLYVTHRVSSRWAWDAGVTFPSGLKTEWGPEFEGRFISRMSSLAVMNVNANVARSLGSDFSVAAGVDVAHVDVKELSRNIDLTPLGFSGSEGFTRMQGAGTGVGWNAAARWARGAWSAGASYRSKIRPGIDGTIVFEDIPPPLAPLFPDGGVSASLPLPASLAIGVAHTWGSSWETEADLVWMEWSAFESLNIDVENETQAGGNPVVQDIVQHENWRNALSYRLGAARHLGARHTLRLGGYRDVTPVPADHMRPRIPDSSRSSVQIGYGFASESGILIDVAYQAIFFDDRTAVGSATDPTNPVLPGEYGNFIGRIGLGLGYRF